MLSVVIVEDEAAARDRLTKLLKAYEDIEIVATCVNGRSALEQIPNLKTDLIFLDVHLPDISGLDVLRTLKNPPHVIFTTAYDTYAVQAFEYNAIDFLLKPFSAERLDQALEKARTNLSETRIAGQLQNLLQTMRQPDQFLERIPAREAERIYILKTQEIAFFQSRDKVVLAYLTDNHFVINYTLDELQDRLDPAQFIRIHRSTIVNLNYVHSIEPLFGGTYLMKINDAAQTELNVSRNAGKLIREKLGW